MMQVIKPGVEFLGIVPTTKEENLNFIESAGRICYKSEDKIEPGTAEKFAKRLISMGHLAMIEHSNFVIRAREADLGMTAAPLMYGRYLSFTRDAKAGYVYAGGNLTAWVKYYKQLTAAHINHSPSLLAFFQPFVEEYGDIFDLPVDIFKDSKAPWQICPRENIPESLHRYSARFICDRGVSHEIVRHRPCSFAQESTRYCDYKDQDLQFIEPWWWADPNQSNMEKKTAWMTCMVNCEIAYRKMRTYGSTPQAARAVLPNSLKTEIIVTADQTEWAHIRNLRTARDAHPDMQCVMNMIPWEMIGLK